MNYMNLLAVVTPISIYYGCSTQKMFWEKKFTQVNIKNGGCRNVRKHRDIKNGEQYIILDTYLKLGNMESTNIKSPEPTYY